MDDTLKNWVIQKIREHLPEIDETAAEELASRAEAYFGERTGRKNVPVRAGWLCCDIALALHAGQSAGQADNIASVKRGDTTVEYRAASSAELLRSLEARLAQYRVGRLA